ncbi:MAG: SdpI family protein [Firmicutes bacterium]|nr:SdpI family protein [Bacillota bacterium]MBQ3122743.1 SdpI family protein [Bacillota bacterium]MBQ9972271.1 SdpI family protein [Bacillota bacterium]
MIKRNLNILIITSVVVMLPAIFGLMIWDRLPEMMPTHWNGAGEIDGYSKKWFAVIGLPAFLLVIHWICVLATSVDPKADRHSKKVLHLVFWITPVLSILLGGVTYATVLGMQIRVEVVMTCFIGLIFVIIGNYLPKCKQNYTIGIKIPWTLDSEENWNRTHRLAGWLWTAGGILMMVTAFFSAVLALVGISILMTIIPIVYSFMLYRKGI